MKKYLSIALIALAILSACSEEESQLQETTTPIAITFDDGITISESTLTRAAQPDTYCAFSIERAYDSNGGERYLQYGEALYLNPNAKELVVRVTQGVKYRLRCLVIQNDGDRVFTDNGSVALPFSSAYHTPDAPTTAITNKFVYRRTQTIFPWSKSTLVTTENGNTSFARVYRYQGEVTFTGGEPIVLNMNRYDVAVALYITPPSEGVIEVYNQSQTLDIYHKVCAGESNYISRSIYAMHPNISEASMSLVVKHTHADGTTSLMLKDGISLRNNKLYTIYVNQPAPDTSSTTTTSKTTSYGYPVKVMITNYAFDVEEIHI